MTTSNPDPILVKLSRWCFTNRRITIAAWLVAVVVMIAAGKTVGSAFDGGRVPPASESSHGFNVLDQYFGGLGAGRSGTIVFRADNGVEDPAVVAAMTTMFDQVGEIDGVTVLSPYLGRGGISDDGLIAFATVDLNSSLDRNESEPIGLAISGLRPNLDGLQVEIGGDSFASLSPPNSELIGLSFAIIVLIVSTGSVLAMGLPIALALAGVGTGTGLIILLSNVKSIPDFATTLAAMIGLGVGIDYALFMVTRYRENLHLGMSPIDATAAAVNTAGRAVLFAGGTVVISLLGLLLMGLPFVAGLGIAAASTVLLTIVASITLLPALLGMARERVEITRYRGLIAAGLVAVALLGVGLDIAPLMIGGPLALLVVIAGFMFAPLRRIVPPRKVKPLRETTSYKWSRLIQSRPWTAAISGASLLLVLAIPMLGIHLGFSDEGNFPPDTTTRKAYDLTAEGFGPGFNGPLLLTIEVGSPSDLATVPELAAAISADPDVVFVSPPVPNDPSAPQAFVLRVIPGSSPQSRATEALVNRLRHDLVPAATAGTGLTVAVSGQTAASIDFSAFLGHRMPLFFGAVLLFSFILLMVVFRSLLVPLKAVIMNLLSIGAAYGVIVAVFQWGWFSAITNVQPAPIEPFIPMMMFAIVFGLSMDYEVFLLSRVREEFNKTGDPVTSVADGLAATARVITAAAAIMVVVFGSFVFEDNRIIELFGVGLATAIAIDATIVRMLLVPATMELLGARNWWIPAWLNRLLPHFHQVL